MVPACLLSFCAYVVNFIPFLHFVGKRFTVQEDTRYISCFRFIDENANRFTVNCVDRQSIYFFRDEKVNFIVLRWL
jgi:hypothetical protein